MKIHKIISAIALSAVVACNMSADGLFTGSMKKVAGYATKIKEAPTKLVAAVVVGCTVGSYLLYKGAGWTYNKLFGKNKVVEAPIVTQEDAQKGGEIIGKEAGTLRFKLDYFYPNTVLILPNGERITRPKQWKPNTIDLGATKPQGCRFRAKGTKGEMIKVWLHNDNIKLIIQERPELFDALKAAALTTFIFTK